MRENLTSGSERGRWKHDLSHAWYVRVSSASAAYSTNGVRPQIRVAIQKNLRYYPQRGVL